MQIADLPPPFDTIILTSPCSRCKFFRGLQFFGVPLICQLHHKGHNWQDTDCEDWIEED